MQNSSKNLNNFSIIQKKHGYTQLGHRVRRAKVLLTAEGKSKYRLDATLCIPSLFELFGYMIPRPESGPGERTSQDCYEKAVFRRQGRD